MSERTIWSNRLIDWENLEQLANLPDSWTNEVLAKEGWEIVNKTMSNWSWDMTKAVYDPNNVGSDAFDMDNMEEWTTNKILTDSERTNISNNTSKVSFPEAPQDWNQYARKDWTWEQVSEWGAVDSVNGKAGAVVLDTDDINEGTINAVLTIEEKKALISGLSSWLRTWGVITQNATNPNNVDVSAGQGIVIDNTDPTNPIYTKVVWTAQTDIVLTNIATEPITNLYFDSTGTLQQWTLANIDSTRRQNILIGVIEHVFSANIESVDNISAQPYDTYVNLDELSSTLGRIKSNTFSTTGLTVNLSAGTTFGIGDNKDSQNPNFMTFVAQSGVTFTPTYRDGVWGWSYWTPFSTIPTTLYDDGTGTLATLQNNNKASVPLIFWNPLSNTFFFQYWQVEYDNIDVAKSEYLTDVQDINPLLGNVIFLWVLGVAKISTSIEFSQNSDKLGQLGLGGWSGASATDLQSGYNVSLPSAEIETNSTNWALSLKWGTGTDTDNNIEIKNNAGTITASVQADGSLDATAITKGWVNVPTISETATLTNKTLTSPVINVTSDATWDLYYRNWSGAFTRLPIGTTGQVLTENSWVPSWEDAWGGGWVNPEYDAWNSWTSITIDWDNWEAQTVTLTWDCTFTLSNPTNGQTYLLRLVQDATGSRTVTLPASVKSQFGTLNFSTGANDIDILSLFYNGTDYYANLGKNYE